jgi:hypothetical protein
MFSQSFTVRTALSIFTGLILSAAACTVRNEPENNVSNEESTQKVVFPAPSKEPLWKDEPNHSGTGSAPPNSTNARGTTCVASKEDPFSCVIQACAAVHGNYDPVMHTCDCPNLEEFFTAHVGGKCLSKTTSVEQLPKDVNYLGPDDFNLISSSLDIGKNGSAIQLSEVFLEIGRIPDSKNNTISNVLLELQPSLFSHAKVPMLQDQGFIMNIVLGENDQINRIRDSLLKNLNLCEISWSAPSNLGCVRSYWEPEPQRWANILQRRQHAVPSELKLSNSNDDLDGLRQVIRDAWNAASSSEQNKTQVVEFHTQDGCAGHCIIERQYPTFAGYKVLEMEEYVGGLMARHQLLAEEVGLPLYHARYAVLEIDPSRSPNLVYLVNVKPEKVSGNPLKSTQVYSRKGELLFSDTKPKVMFNLQHELVIRDSIRDKSNDASNSSVVVCDAGIKPSRLPNLRVGPRTDLSFWGWLEPNKQEFSLWEQLSGVIWYSKLNDLVFDVMYGDHGGLVAGWATENTNLSVIPFSLQCFSQYSQWKENVRKFARVVNYSAGNHYDEASCHNAAEFREPLLDPEQPFLWVLSAGNIDRDVLTIDKMFRCPFAWAPRPNILVVNNANQGRDTDYTIQSMRFYPDISVEGAKSTSEATARVSRVAALLAQEFPGLSIEHIRASIMLGAHIPMIGIPQKFQSLRVRSGGILDEQRARRVASYISKTKIRTPITIELATEILTQLGCNSDINSRECKLATFKSNWLQAHQAFPEKL